jgi:hypothetical protein
MGGIESEAEDYDDRREPDGLAYRFPIGNAVLTEGFLPKVSRK